MITLYPEFISYPFYIILTALHCGCRSSFYLAGCHQQWCQHLNMPKEQREQSLSLERSRRSPFPRSSRPKQTPLEVDNSKQWEDTRCPVCMEHPHNAILLLCSSHEKGCRPFMCDTSYRHSNCFDQFRKSSGEPSNLPEASPLVPHPNKLACPLCRGVINGWVVVDPARNYMNLKLRSCASQTCDYSGTYKELRKHARSEHPLVRPAEVELERQQEWRRLERQRDLGDLISMLSSSSDESMLNIDMGDLVAVFYLVRVIRPRRDRTEEGD